MNNPWQELSFVEGTYVLKEDWECICRHNHFVGECPTKFVLDSIPEPFIGNKESATVVLLGKNPGHKDVDVESHKDTAFREAMFSNLRHRPQPFSFYPLNPKFAWTGAGEWWRERTRELREVGISEEAIATKLMVIEWMPYHSKSFARPKYKCASQLYSFWLAKEMLKTKLVIRMRARAEWAEAGQEFLGLPALKNPQCAHISGGNTLGELFDQIVAALKD